MTQRELAVEIFDAMTLAMEINSTTADLADAAAACVMEMLKSGDLTPEDAK